MLAAALTTQIALASKYITDGFKIGGDNPVWHLSAELATPLDGISLQFWSALQVNRANQSYDELDAMVRYAHTFLGDKRLAVNVHGFADYWVYPKATVPSLRGNKLQAGVSLTNLLDSPQSWLVPSYNVFYWLYWDRGQRTSYQGGARHELGLQYIRTLPRLIPGTDAQSAAVGGTLNYNDGAFRVRPGWTHSTAHVGTTVSAWGCQFSLSVDRQWSYEPSVNPENELWSTFSFSKTF